MKKSVVLLSSGLDSTVNFYQALLSSQVLLALTFDYGQRAARREIERAQKITQAKGITHKIVELPFFKDWGSSSLVDTTKNVPVGHEVEIDNLSSSRRTAASVWVPNRNGVLLNIAAGFAESISADWIIPGFNSEEAATFPDNSEDFLQAMTRSLYFSTAQHVEVKCFTTQLSKNAIVRQGIQLGVDFEQIWPCYFSGIKWCGKCESCQRSRRALDAAGLSWQALGGE